MSQILTNGPGVLVIGMLACLVGGCATPSDVGGSRQVRCQGAGAVANAGVSVRPLLVAALNRMATSSAGTAWRGTLTYLDYTSTTRETITSNVRVRRDEGAGGWRWDVSYTDEPHADAGAALSISADGQTLRNGDSAQRIISEESPQPGELVLTTEERGQDDGRAATIRRVYRFEPRMLTLTKFVQFEGDSAGAEFVRHEYRWAAGQ